MTREILLTQGKVALVDDEDYERVNQYKWVAYKGGRKWYAYRSVYTSKGTKETLSMHKFILNPRKGMLCDHLSDNGLDNRECNLREATPTQNLMNSRKRMGTSSQFKGVTWVKMINKWGARIYTTENNHRKCHSLGNYSNEKDAAHAYDCAARKIFKEYAYLNFPMDGERGMK